MRIVDAIPLLLLLALAAHGPHTAAVEPVKLIVDTDIGGGGCNDVDDVVAVCISHALERRGEAKLLAIVQNTAPLQCAGAISVLNTWYRREDLPIGAYDIATSGATLELEAPLPYVVELADHWPSAVKNSTQVPDAVTVYRQALAVQPARSVAISSIGIHTNLAALLRSGPDAHSPLSGVELVRQKVKLLAVMGGKYGGQHGSHSGGPACNLCGGGKNAHNARTASAASSFVAAHWPPESQIIWSGFEVVRLSPARARSYPVRATELLPAGRPGDSLVLSVNRDGDRLDP
jgi:purine nucleosidase